MPRVPLHPKHPERTCWGCDLYCPADDLRCGNGTIRTPHPVELFGDDWLDAETAATPAAAAPARVGVRTVLTHLHAEEDGPSWDSRSTH